MFQSTNPGARLTSSCTFSLNVDFLQLFVITTKTRLSQQLVNQVGHIFQTYFGTVLDEQV